jgi:ribosomal protein L7/L12
MPGRIRVVGINVGSVSRKVEQIKAIRQASGWGLKESKDAVDDLAASNKPIVIECDVNMRNHYAAMLRQTGLFC